MSKLGRLDSTDKINDIENDANVVEGEEELNPKDDPKKNDKKDEDDNNNQSGHASGFVNDEQLKEGKHIDAKDRFKEAQPTVDLLGGKVEAVKQSDDEVKTEKVQQSNVVAKNKIKVEKEPEQTQNNDIVEKKEETEKEETEKKQKLEQEQKERETAAELETEKQEEAGEDSTNKVENSDKNKTTGENLNEAENKVDKPSQEEIDETQKEINERNVALEKKDIQKEGVVVSPSQNDIEMAEAEIKEANLTEATKEEYTEQPVERPSKEEIVKTEKEIKEADLKQDYGTEDFTVSDIKGENIDDLDHEESKLSMAPDNVVLAEDKTLDGTDKSTELVEKVEDKNTVKDKSDLSPKEIDSSKSECKISKFNEEKHSKLEDGSIRTTENTVLSDKIELFNGDEDIDDAGDGSGLSDNLNELEESNKHIENNDIDELFEKYGKENFSIHDSFDYMIENKEQIIKDNYTLSKEGGEKLVSVENKKTLKELRESVEKPTTETIMQKVIPLVYLEYYTNPDQNLIDETGGILGGFMSKACDTVPYVNNPKEAFENLGLDYNGTKFDSSGKTNVYVIRFRISENDLKKLDIPYSKEFDANGQERLKPCTGSGATGGNVCYIPEYITKSVDTSNERKNRFLPIEGVIFELTPDGKERPFAIWDDEKERFIEIQKRRTT